LTKDQIRDWSGALVKTIDPVISDEVIIWKRANPAEDLLTALTDAEDHG
jgi:hypothetical protein